MPDLLHHRFDAVRKALEIAFHLFQQLDAPGLLPGVQPELLTFSAGFFQALLPGIQPHFKAARRVGQRSDGILRFLQQSGAFTLLRLQLLLLLFPRLQGLLYGSAAQLDFRNGGNRRHLADFCLGYIRRQLCQAAGLLLHLAGILLHRAAQLLQPFGNSGDLFLPAQYKLILFLDLTLLFFDLFAQVFIGKGGIFQLMQNPLLILPVMFSVVL